MKRRELTAEEHAEAMRLTSAWLAYKSTNPGTTQAWLASASGLGTQGAVGQYLRGVIPLNLEGLIAICNVIGADPQKISPRLLDKMANYVVTAPEGSSSVITAEDEFSVTIKRVKLKLQAGINKIQSDNCIEVGEPVTYTKDHLQRRGLFAEDLIALEVRGSSMEPNFLEGDIIVINMADKVPKDGKVFAINFNGEAVVKRFKYKNREWFLSSDNPDKKTYHDELCRGSDCCPIGIVIDVRREFF